MIKRIKIYIFILILWLVIPFILKIFGFNINNYIFLWCTCIMLGNFLVIIIETVKSRVYFSNNYPEIYEKFLRLECFEFKKIFVRKKCLNSILEETKDNNLIVNLKYLKRYSSISFFVMGIFMFLYILLF